MSDSAGPVAATSAKKSTSAAAPWLDNPTYESSAASIADVGKRAGNGAAALIADRAGDRDGADENDPMEALQHSDPDRAARLEAKASVLLSAESTARRYEVLTELQDSLGVGGARFYRSDEVRAFRKQMKTAARARAAADIALLHTSEDEDHGAATRQYLNLIARGEAYGLSKESVDQQLSTDALGWVQHHWDVHDDSFEQAELPADGAVVLTGTVPLASWEELFEAGVFHLDDEPAPAGFEPQLPVRLRLGLRRQVITRFEDPEELLRALLGGEDRALLSTEAWFALEAMQRLPVPGQAEGWVDIRTSYAER